MALASVDSYTRRTTCKLSFLYVLTVTLSRDTRTRLVHSIKASASGVEDLQVAEIIRQKGLFHGFTPLQPWVGFPASVPGNNMSSIKRSKPVRLENFHQRGEDGILEDISVYMEAQEVVDLPMLGDQGYTQNEDTPADSVLVSEGNITSWLKAVPADLAHLTSSPTLESLCEETNLSEIQPGVDESPLPTCPLNHQSPSPSQSPPTRRVCQLPGRFNQLGVSPHRRHENVQNHSGPRISRKGAAKRRLRMPPPPFENDIATLCARLLAEGADPHYVELLRRKVFTNEISNDALMAPTRPSNQLSGKRWTEKAWHLLVEQTGSFAYSCRLCPQNERRQYKDNRNVLRHLRKDHFGLALVCECWWVDIPFHG
jgi:hypothetical protein